MLYCHQNADEYRMRIGIFFFRRSISTSAIYRQRGSRQKRMIAGAPFFCSAKKDFGSIRIDDLSMMEKMRTEGNYQNQPGAVRLPPISKL